MSTRNRPSKWGRTFKARRKDSLRGASAMINAGYKALMARKKGPVAEGRQQFRERLLLA